MRQIYIPLEDWDQVFAAQAVQSGHGIPGFEGVAFQRGSGGIENFLGRLFRFILPVAKKAAKSVGKQALSTGVNIIGDAVKGRNIKEAAKEHGRKALGNIASNVEKYINQQGNGMGYRDVNIKKTRAVKRKKKQPRGGKRTAYRDVFGNV